MNRANNTAQAESAMQRNCVVGVYPYSVVGFRGDLIRAMVAEQHDVTVMTADCEEETRAEIESLGVTFRPYPVKRNGMDPRTDLGTLRHLKQAFREMQPDVMLAYTIKPIVWGGRAIRVVPNCRFFALITGLGYAFQGGSLKRRLLNRLVSALYKQSLRRAEGVIFQNPDNLELFVERGIVERDKCHVVAGSGVNTEDFSAKSLPDGPLRFLLIARLLGEKGIREYAAAARQIRKEYPDVTFSLVGPEDPSPDGIPIDEIKRLHDAGNIEYLGATKDVRPYIEQSHVYVLPSYHEGMPRTVLEAMAMGRPIITTDTTGCRETVEAGNNGWLVPVADTAALEVKMKWCIENRDALQEMGDSSRRLAEQRFDVRKVNQDIIEIMYGK